MFKFLKNKKFFLYISLFLLFFLRLPSWFFNWWYVDENIYLAVASDINLGEWLYIDTCDNKPPLIYLVYFAIFKMFGVNMLIFKLINTILGAITIIFFYLILKNLFKKDKIQKWINVIILIFTILWSGAFESVLFNGENLFVPFILIGGYFSLKYIKNKTSKNQNWYLLIIESSWFLASFTKMQALLEVLVLYFLFSLIIIKKQMTVVNLKNLYLTVKKDSKIKKYLILTILPTILAYLGLFILYILINKLDYLWFGIIGFSKGYIIVKNAYLFGIELPITGLFLRSITLIFILIILTINFWLKKNANKRVFDFWLGKYFLFCSFYSRKSLRSLFFTTFTTHFFINFMVFNQIFKQ